MRLRGNTIWLEDDDRWLVDTGAATLSMQNGLRLASRLFATASRQTRLAECFKENEMWVDAVECETSALESSTAAKELAALASPALGALIEYELRH